MKVPKWVDDKIFDVVSGSSYLSPILFVVVFGGMIVLGKLAIIYLTTVL